MLTGPSAWNFIRFIFGSQNEQDHRGGLRYRRSPSLIAHFTADSARRNKRARLSLYINERKEDAWIWFIPGHLLQRWRNHSPRHDKCPSSVKYTKQRRLKREEVLKKIQGKKERQKARSVKQTQGKTQTQRAAEWKEGGEGCARFCSAQSVTGKI